MSSTGALNQRNSSTPPRLLGPYHIIEIIGGGGMGVVYRGKHAETGEVVAVKTVRIPEERMLASIRREIHALSRIRHEGVVRVVDQGYDAGLPWFAMELLKGRTLSDEIKSLWGGHHKATLGTVTAMPSGDDWPASSSGDGVPNTSFERALTAFGSSPMAVSAVFETRGAHPALRSERSSRETLLDEGRARIHGICDEDTAPAPDAALLNLRPKASPASQEKLLRMLLSIAETLAVLHGAGVVHRDLKTENIFLRAATGTPILVDFGLAVPGALGREILRVGGGLEGTLPYTSPEQLLGEFVDARADLYSFGCVFYECLTGRPPFVSDSMSELVHMHLHRRPLPPSEWADGISPELDALVLSLLQKDPRKRIGYATDVRAKLEEIVGADSAPKSGLSKSAHALYRAGFAGRRHEMKGLERRRTELREGKGGLHLLSGPTGIGKTRLLMEFMRWIRRDEVMMVAGQSSGLGFSDKPGLRIQAAPLHPLREFFLALIDAYQERSPEDISRILGDDLKVLAKFEPLLLTLPGAENAAEPAELPSDAAQQRVIDALKRMLGAIAAEKPILLVLDDVQWADELSLRFLSSLSDAEFASRPVLVIAAFRDKDLPEELTALIAKKGVELTQLSELGEHELESVVGDMLAVEKPHPALLGHLMELPASGNPFFISELLHVVWERGLLRRSDAGDWEFQLGLAASNEPLPRDIVETSVCRLSVLSPGVRKVLEIASVWGRILEVDRLVGLEGLGQAEIMDALDELLVHGLVQSEQTGEIGFVHDGVYRAAYGQLSEERRRALHAVIGERLEKEENDERILPLLAHHYLEAGIAPKAFHYLIKNARNTLKSGAHKQAMVLLARAEQLMGGGNTGGFIPSREERVTHALLSAESAFCLGDAEKALSKAGEVMELYGRPLPKSASGWIGRLLWAVSQQLTGLSLRSARAVQADDIRSMYGHCSSALNWVCQSYVTLADPLRILGACFMMANEAELAGELGNPAFAYSIIGATVGTVGMNKKAIDYFQRAHAIATKRRDLHERVNVAVPELGYYLGAAMWDRLEAAAAELGPLAKSIGAKNQWEAITMIYGSYRMRCHGSEGVLELLNEPIESAHKRSNPLSGAWASNVYAQCLLVRGENDEVMRIAEQIYPIVLKGSGPAAGAGIQSMMAHVALRRGQIEEAQKLAISSLQALKRETLMFMHEPACRMLADALLELAERAARETKDPSQELKAAKIACKMLEAMAGRYPFARSVSMRMWARYYRIEKKAPRARKMVERALETAGSLGMLPEEACARLELARHSRVHDEPASFEKHWEEAKHRLERAGDLAGLAMLEKLRNLE